MSGRRGLGSLSLMAASGFAGLGYQIVWTQQCALWLGHECAAVLAVVTAFFGGLALGSLALGPRIEASPRPLAWYVGCELATALWACVLLLAMAPASAALLRATGAEPTPAWQWSVAFVGTLLLILPATAAMGATLPAMERLVSAPHDGARSIAGLYASNTLGAVLGVVGVAFALIPALGLARTTLVCIVLDLGCAAAAPQLFAASSSPPAAARSTSAARGILARLAVTGLLGIGYEVLVVRVLAQVTEDTVYTFASLLAIYLVGTSLGGAAYARRRVFRADDDRVRDTLLGALAAACIVGSASLWFADETKAAAHHALGGGFAGALGAEAVLGLVAFGPATFVMGALFSHLARTASDAGVSFGLAIGMNLLGGAAAPALFGVVLFPWVGPKHALLLLGAGYVVSIAPRAWSRPVAYVPALALLVLVVMAPPLAFVDVPEGGHVVRYRDGVMAAVSVVEDAAGVLRLRIDDREQEGSSATFRVDARQAWLPILLHPGPRHALFLGLGTGVTASAAAEDPALEVDAVELLPEVIDASDLFLRATGDGAPNPRLRRIAADARRWVRASSAPYDLIVSDNFHPARSGSGALYTVEHFEAVRARLAADGSFCQWLPLHQLDLATLRSIVRSFSSVFPRGWAMLASYSLETPVIGLVARGDGDRLDAAAIHDRLARTALPDRVSRIGLEDELAVLGSFVAGPAALRRFAADAPLNTDDHPVVAYRAPRITYAPDSRPRERLATLLRELSIDPDELVAKTPDARWPARLAAYWSARDRFIESGRDVRPSADVRAMLAQVREPLLAVLRISPDFRPAYDPLLAMATALARIDPGDAARLLAELDRLQPARDEARHVLARFSDSTKP